MDESLVTISEAAGLLGVSEVALRQWTNEGKIKVFITPGGHRRYSKADLKRFIRFRQKTLGVKDLVAELEATIQLHREIARESITHTTWYKKLNADSQERLAYLGRELLNVTIRYINEPSKRDEVINLVRDVGHRHGETLAKLGLPLTDSIEAFILHRDPMTRAVTKLMRKRGTYTGRIVETILLVDHVMDEALVAFVTAHQQYRNGIRQRKEDTVHDRENS